MREIRQAPVAPVGVSGAASQPSGNNVIKTYGDRTERPLSSKRQNGGIGVKRIESGIGDERLIRLLGHQLRAVKRFTGEGNRGSRLLAWDMRCVSGDTIINVNRAGKGFSLTIAEMYQRIRDGWWRADIPTRVRSLVNGEIRLQEIEYVIYSGLKECIQIELEDGKVLDVTADHKVATDCGWIEAGNLSKGQSVLTNGTEGCKRCGEFENLVTYKYAKFPGYCRKCINRYLKDNGGSEDGRSIDCDGYIRVSGQYDHPRAQGSGYQVKEHELVMERMLGRYLLWPDEVVHHKDENKQNNDPSNLELKSPSEHATGHGNYKHFGPMTVPHQKMIVGIHNIGMRDVYDLVMAGDHPNFVANGIVVHNCGKTAGAIAIDTQLRRDIQRQQRGNNCTLICCPKSALYVWEDHLRRMGISPSNIRIIDLPGKRRIKKTLAYIAAKKRLKSMKEGYVVINWDSVAPLGKELRIAGPWFHIIGDEIHRIKSRKTARTLAFLKLRSKQRTALSGTPADNKPEDFWQVLAWLLPSRFTSYWRFVDTYCTTWVSRTGYKRITGVNESALADLHREIAPYYDRVRITDVADMPQHVFEMWEVDMGEKQRREYDELVENDIASINGGDIIASLPISKIVRQQQMAIGCCQGEWTERLNRGGEQEPWFDISIIDTPPSPKLDAIIDWLTDEENEGEFVVVGAQHPDTIEMLRARCERLGITNEVVTGITGPVDRDRAIGSFQGGRSRVFMGTIACIREGIDLSRARTIIRIDKPWNPNWNKQFEARCDSIFDPQPTKIIDIVARNSIDGWRIDRIGRKATDTELMIG